MLLRDRKHVFLNRWNPGRADDQPVSVNIAGPELTRLVPDLSLFPKLSELGGQAG